ncbi:Uncharacterized protein CTYZ_00000587 [Cryptosporidium tyzzeri]|nr:Uncharacterized protein CTYZ_00000587 [Cryptosporidium tyzzeri]
MQISYSNTLMCVLIRDDIVLFPLMILDCMDLCIHLISRYTWQISILIMM